MERVLYLMDPYLSHQRAARPYVGLLRRTCAVIERTPSEAELASVPGRSPAALCGPALESADAVIVHAELARDGWRSVVPALKRSGRKLIAYSVWEADALPPVYVEALRHFDEIWTPSRFCQRVYQRSFARTARVPHVVEMPPSPPRKAEDAIEFLVFLKEGDRRKNPRQALVALDATFAQWPKRWPRFRLHLVLRNRLQDWSGPDYEALRAFVRRWPGAIRSWFRPTDRQLLALYRRAHVLVSLHHGEAWGLTLSEAMAHGVLVVASNWSGNLDYMSTSSSFLVDGRVEVVRRQHRNSLLQPPMRWFYPDLRSAVRQIRNACRAWVYKAQAPYVEAGRRALAGFSAEAMAPVIAGRLAALEDPAFGASRTA